MSIYTKKGDQGETCLINGKIISKADKVLVTIGGLDELNGSIGLGICDLKKTKFSDVIGECHEIQKNIMGINANLAASGANNIEIKLPKYPTQKDVKQLEKWIDRYDLEIPKLKNFILPGGSRSASCLHLARTICRRAERSLASLNADAVYKQYINRLSDYLFTVARVANSRTGYNEQIWK